MIAKYEITLEVRGNAEDMPSDIKLGLFIQELLDQNCLDIAVTKSNAAPVRATRTDDEFSTDFKERLRRIKARRALIKEG